MNVYYTQKIKDLLIKRAESDDRHTPDEVFLINHLFAELKNMKENMPDPATVFDKLEEISNEQTALETKFSEWEDDFNNHEHDELETKAQEAYDKAEDAEAKSDAAMESMENLDTEVSSLTEKVDELEARLETEEKLSFIDLFVMWVKGIRR